MKKSKKDTWNLGLLYKKDNDPNIKKDRVKVAKINKAFNEKWRKRKDYLKNPKVLRQALDEMDQIAKNYGLSGKYGYYFSLRSAQEQDNTNLKGILNQIVDEATKLENEGQFFELNLSKVDKKTQTVFLKSPELEKYKHYLKNLFENAKYLLSELEEKILNLKSNPSHGQWVSMVSTLLSKQSRKVYDEKGNLKELPLSEIISLSNNSNKKIRNKAFEAMMEINEKYAEVAEAEMNAIMLNKKINDELRGFDRPDKSRHLADDMETEVVDALIETVSKNFSISKDYYRLKANLFKTDKLDYTERNVPYGQINKKFSWSSGKKLVSDTLYELDAEFGDIFEDFVNHGQIDVFPYKGKGAGAFCAYNLKSQPIYILLNYTNKLNDILTLAHEVGHGINDELMKKSKHPALYFYTPLSTAEVASTFIEDFVLEKLLGKADPELSLALHMNRLNDEVSTIFRQVAAYRFEKELHETFRKTGYVAKEDIGKIFSKHMQAYMGPYVDQPQGVENLWVYWSHFRNFFYVYSYASGLLISKALQAKVKSDKNFIKNIKKFLATGGAESPKDIFSKLGIDITDKKFWQSGLNEIKQSLKETEKTAKNLGKI